LAYRIELSKRAERDFRQLPRNAQRQVARKMEALKEEPRPAGAKQLSATEGIYRVRSGDYRILYRIEDDVLLVLVVRIGDRREVYRSLSDP
jgi:mRNA interferase RelE/StbE